MQRYLNPIVRFKTEADVEEFIDNSKGIWKNDYSGGLLENGKIEQSID